MEPISSYTAPLTYQRATDPLLKVTASKWFICPEEGQEGETIYGRDYSDEETWLQVLTSHADQGYQLKHV